MFLLWLLASGVQKILVINTEIEIELRNTGMKKHLNILVIASLSILLMFSCGENDTTPFDGDNDIEEFDVDNEDEVEIVDQDYTENGEYDIDPDDEDVNENDIINDGDIDIYSENEIEQENDTIEDGDLDIDSEYEETLETEFSDDMEEIDNSDYEENMDEDVDYDCDGYESNSESSEYEEEDFTETDIVESVENDIEDRFPPLYPCGTDDSCPNDANICKEGLCVQCRTADDCPDSFSCIENHCHVGCEKDSDCCPEGYEDTSLCSEKMYCNDEYGRCGDCKVDSDCDESQKCFAGQCLSEECFISFCIDSKHYYICENDTVTGIGKCSTNKHCSGMWYPPCETHSCIPYAYYCDGSNLKQCSANGQAWNLIRNCPETCSEEFGRCVPVENDSQ